MIYSFQVRTTALIISLFCIVIYGEGQAQKGEQQLELELSLPTKSIHDGTGLKLKVVLKNKAKEILPAYSVLVEGYPGDYHTNFNYFIEKLEKGQYKRYELRTLYQSLPDDDSTDRIPRVTISSQDSIVYYHQVDDAYAFSPGKYRLRCDYLNDINKRDRTHSDWIYFTITKNVPVKHYYW